MKKIALIAALVCSAFISSAKLSEVTDINDLALIYIGSQHRPDWDKELFRPYVVHEYADGRKSWMFDGFLMIEFMKWNKNGVQVSFGEYNSDASQKEDWIDLLDVQLGTYTGQGCRALDDLIGELIPQLGQPGYKHKVVLTMPSAEAKSGNTWGELNGRSLNFTSSSDCILALKWYADLIEQKWKEAGFKNLELEGVYWVKESFSGVDRTIVTEANDYFRTKKGFNVFWIPYFTATSRFEWADLGIDVAYLQPNYYFKETTPISQLQQAVEDAWEHGLGLEMEFEGYNYSWSPSTNVRTKYTCESCGLYDVSPAFYQRLVDYIDHFEKEAVFTYLPIAYYSGFEAVYDFMTSGNKKDHELMDRLALLMNARHVDNGWDKEPTAGIDNVTTGDNTIAYAVDGGIYISDSAADAVSIYTTDGRQVYALDGERLSYGKIYSCPRGVYIVRCGDRAVKVAVR